MNDKDTDRMTNQEALESLGIDENDIEYAIAARELIGEQQAMTRSVLDIGELSGETECERNARATLRPDVQAGLSLLLLNERRFPDLEINALVSRLEDQAERLAAGNLAISKHTLASQVATLDALFHGLLQQSVYNMSSYTDTAREYMKLALKAQSQCRATIGTLADIKKPPSRLLKQTNIAHGHQQVNNLPDENPPNELMERPYDERMDPGAPSEAVRGDQALEAMEGQHWSQND